MKKILGIYNSPEAHWVGNGFLVNSLFSYNDLGAEMSPFLLSLITLRQPSSALPPAPAVWVSIRIVGLKRSPSSTKAKWSTVIPPAAAG